MKTKIKVIGKTTQKLSIVKLVKEYTGMGLKEAKAVCDESWNNSTPILELEIDKSEVEKAKEDFTSLGLSVTINDRERKMKRILYVDQDLCIKDMLNDVAKWDTLELISDADKENLTYNQCREKAIEIIFNRYSEYIKGDTFMQMYKDISDINEFETKPTEVKFIKFNEEFGEMCAEYLKLKGHTYKPYDREELLGEMADTLQVLLSIFSDIEKDTDIFLSDVIEKVKEKNIKWKNKISDYTNKL